MEHDRVGRFARGALGTLAGLVAVLPAAALPPEENQSWIEVGAWVNSDDSYKFGDFTGLEEKGVSLLANFDISRRAVWDSGDVRWWRAQGQNLGLDSRWARGDFGYQGLFDVWFEYQEIPKYQTDSASHGVPGQGNGSADAAPGWVVCRARRQASARSMRTSATWTSTTSAATCALASGSICRADLEWVGDYEYETKKGRKIVGAVIGSSGGNPRSSLVPEPLDYQTNEGTTALRWNGERAQLQIGYEISVFNDSNDSLTWQNPFSLLAGECVGYPNGFGRKVDPTRQQLQSGVDEPAASTCRGTRASRAMRRSAGCARTPASCRTR